MKKTNINYLKLINDLAKSSLDKLVNKEIPMTFDYLEPKRPC